MAAARPHRSCLIEPGQAKNAAPPGVLPLLRKSMLSLYKQPLIDLYWRVHELEADRVEKRLLALEIQEELLRCIVRAEARIRRRRKLNAQTKRELSNRENSRETSNELRKIHER